MFPPAKGVSMWCGNKGAQPSHQKCSSKNVGEPISDDDGNNNKMTKTKEK